MISSNIIYIMILDVVLTCSYTLDSTSFYYHNVMAIQDHCNHDHHFSMTIFLVSKRIDQA